MIKLIVVILGVLVLCGCEKIVTQKDIKLAEGYCSGKGGLFSIGVTGESIVKTITCKNGDIADSNDARKSH